MSNNISENSNAVYFIDPFELVKMLIREGGFTEGQYMMIYKFRFYSCNTIDPERPQADVLFPTGLMQIIAVGLQRVSEPNNMSVDASTVKHRAKKPAKANPGILDLSDD